MGHETPCHAPPLHTSWAVSYQPLIQVVSIVRMVMAEASTYAELNGSTRRRNPKSAPQRPESENKRVAMLSGCVTANNSRRGVALLTMISPDSTNRTHVESKTMR